MDGINLGHILFSFEGRINRGKFWLGWLLVWVLQFVVFFLVLSSPGAGSVVFLLILLLLWPTLAIQVKRWHDRDKSGAWILIVLVPIIGPLWAFVETGFVEGTRGPNRYGPDPLGGHGRSPYGPGPSLMEPAPEIPPGWYADPHHRHQHRYWNGSAWTEHVGDDGVQGTDPLPHT